MGKLTNWLDSFKVTPVARHDKFPALVKPPNFQEKPMNECIGCPLVGQPHHESYGCGKLLAPLPVENRPRISIFGILQYLLHRISADIFPTYGSGSFAHYGEKAINFATTWGFKVTAAAGEVVSISTEETGEDLRALGLYTIRKANWGVQGSTWITIPGPIQPNAIGHAGGGSLITNKIRARLRKVIIHTPYTADLYFDQNMSGVMEDNREDQTDPYVPMIYLLGQYSDREQWTPVVKPSILKCHKRAETFKVEQLPPDGKLSLLRQDGTEGRAAVPKAADDKHPATMMLWVKLKDQEELVDKSSEVFSRFKSISMGPGADGRGAYRSLLCLGTKDHEDNEVFVNLITPEVEHFIVEWYSEVPDFYTGQDWCSSARFSRRCVHCVQDESNSYYNMDDGEAHLANGEEWYCNVRRTYEIVETPDGRWAIEWHKPAKTELFTADCYLAGVCPMFSPINDHGEGLRGFTLSHTANYILKEMSIGIDIALVQIWPGYSIYRVKRMGRPTIHGLTFSHSFANPVDWSPTVMPVQNGSVIYGDFNTMDIGPEQDEWGNIISAGGTIFNPLRGGAWDGREPFSELVYPNAPSPGIFPSLIPGWTNKIDALRRPWDDQTDTYHAVRNYEDDMAARVKLSSQDGPTFGRGVSQATRIVGGDEKFLLPMLDLNDGTEGKVQDRNDVTFEWFTSTQYGPGNWPYLGIIKFKKLIAEGKQPKGAIKSAVIGKATYDAANKELVLELENQEDRWARLRNDGPYNSWNEIYTFFSGGRIFRPPDFMIVRSSENRDSSLGGTTDWVTVGDAAWFDMGTEDFKKHRFTVSGGGAFLGEQEPSFKAKQSTVTFDWVGGFYQIPESDLVTADGIPGEPGIVEVVTAQDATAGDTSIILAESGVPFRVDQFIKVDGTNEILRCVGYDEANKIIYVWRQQNNVPAQPIPQGTKLSLVEVYDRWLGRAFTVKRDETKPSLAAGEAWYDASAARYYWSPVDFNDTVCISYYLNPAAGEILSPSRARYVDEHRIFETVIHGTAWSFPLFDTYMLAPDFDPVGDPATKVYIGDTEQEIIDTGAPSAGKVLKVIDSEQHVLLLADRATAAGATGRLEIGKPPTDEVPFEFDVTDMPEFATGAAWGRKRAVMRLKDENNWLQANAPNMVGKTVNVVRHEQVLSPDSEASLLYWQYKVDNIYDANPDWLLLDRGQGFLYLNGALISAMRSIPGRIVCAEVS